MSTNPGREVAFGFPDTTKGMKILFALLFLKGINSFGYVNCFNFMVTIGKISDKQVEISSLLVFSKPKLNLVWKIF